MLGTYASLASVSNKRALLKSSTYFCGNHCQCCDFSLLAFHLSLSHRPLTGSNYALQLCHMGNTITIRVPKTLAAWLQEKSARTGISQGQIVREQLERVRRGDKKTKSFMRLAGAIRTGARDLSTRKGFAKS